MKIKTKITIVAAALLFSFNVKAFLPAGYAAVELAALAATTPTGVAAVGVASAAATSLWSGLLGAAAMGASIFGFTQAMNDIDAKVAIATQPHSAMNQPDLDIKPTSNETIQAFLIYGDASFEGYGVTFSQAANDYIAKYNERNIVPLTHYEIIEGVSVNQTYICFHIASQSVGGQCQRTVNVTNLFTNPTVSLKTGCQSGYNTYTGTFCVKNLADTPYATDKICSVSFDSTGCPRYNPTDPDCMKAKTRITTTCTPNTSGKVVIADPTTGVSLSFDRQQTGAATVKTSSPTQETTATMSPGATATDAPVVSGTTTATKPTTANPDPTNPDPTTPTTPTTGIDMSVPDGSNTNLDSISDPNFDPSFFDRLKNKFMMNFAFTPHNGSCPALVLDFTFPIIAKPVLIQTNKHCELLEDSRSLIQAVMMFFYAFLGIRKILEA